MLELDDLKSTWQTYNQLQIVHNKMSENEVAKMLQKKTKGIIANIKQSIGIDTALLGVFTLIFLLFQSKLPPEMIKIFNILLLVAWPITLIFSALAYQSLNRVSNIHEGLKQSLWTLAIRMKRLLRLSHIIVAIAPAIGFFVGFYAGYEGQTITYREILMLVGFALSACAIFYPIAKWYIHKLYGRHYEQLKECLEELEG